MKLFLPIIIAAVGIIALFASLGMYSGLTDNQIELLIVADEPEPMRVLIGNLQAKGCSVAYTDQPELADNLKKYDGVIMYIHDTMNTRTESILVDYTRNGGRLIILHHGIASARMKNPLWQQMTGVYLELNRSKPRRWKVLHNMTYNMVNLNPEHYITSNNVTYPKSIEYESGDYPSRVRTYNMLEFHDTEIFLNQQFTDGRSKTILYGLQCRHPEDKTLIRQDRAGWFKSWGRGWIFYFQPGHTVEDFQNAAYCQIIHNCLTWKP